MDLSRLGIPVQRSPRRCRRTVHPPVSGQLLAACRVAWEQGGRLCALWLSDERDRERGYCLRVVLEDRMA